jgi:hypothetical protein
MCHYIARMLPTPNSMCLWAGAIAVSRPLRKHVGEIAVALSTRKGA